MGAFFDARKEAAMNVIICRGPKMKEVKNEPLGERWCFKCRKRTEFMHKVMAPVEPSYYGPHPTIECANGHVDGDCGFGSYREWEEC